MANNNNITLNKELLAALNIDPGLPVSIQTMKALKNLSFTSEYNDITNAPKKLSDFENDITTGSKYAIYKEEVTRYDYTATSTGIVTYSIPNDKYNANMDSLEIYIDNVKLIEGDNYTVSANTITIGYSVDDDTVIVNLIKSLRPVVEIDADTDYESFSRGYVPNTTTIAGIPLTDNITVEQLSAAGIGSNKKEPMGYADNGGIIGIYYTDKIQPDYVSPCEQGYITYIFDDDGNPESAPIVFELDDPSIIARDNENLAIITTGYIDHYDMERPYLIRCPISDKETTTVTISDYDTGRVIMTKEIMHSCSGIYIPIYINLNDNLIYIELEVPQSINITDAIRVTIS